MDQFIISQNNQRLFEIPSFPGVTPLEYAKPSLDIPCHNGIYNGFLPSSYTPNQRTRACSFSSSSPVDCYSPVKSGIAPTTNDLTNILLMLKLQQNIQSEILRQNVKRMLELKTSLVEQLSQQQLQQQSQIHRESPIHIPELLPVQEDNLNSKVKIEMNEEIPVQIQRGVHSAHKKALKSQIKDIINFVLDNFGRVNETNFEKEKLKYSYDPDLILIFDLLNSKYASTIKTKEEMVKYTLRRAFKFMKSNLKKETNAGNKGVCRTLCSKYFHASQEDMSKLGNEEEFLKVLLPFRKNSKNKTMNTTFINEVFASEEFSKDYLKYLDHFENILEADNKNKIDRLANFIEECLKKGKLRDIKNYKRIPWPKVWIINTVNIAKSLPNMGNQVLSSPNGGVKKVKTETDFSQRSSKAFVDINDSLSEASTNSHSI